MPLPNENLLGNLNFPMSLYKHIYDFQKRLKSVKLSEINILDELFYKTDLYSINNLCRYECKVYPAIIYFFIKNKYISHSHRFF